MSVYTPVSDNEFSEILKNYSLGDFVSAQGIKAGIENTNYFITTTAGEFVFTLFEKISQQELEHYISLLKHLSANDIACPQPQADNNQQTVNSFQSKPFTIVSRLKGNNPASVNLNQINAVAQELAKLHRVTSTIPGSLNNTLRNRRGSVWRQDTVKKLIAKISSDETKLLTSELSFFQSFNDHDLPKGIIHADLFKDNALFEKDKLCGIIDFYDACYDNYLYDIAITVNAWCCDDQGKFISDFVTNFLDSYQAIRPLTMPEKLAWPIMLRMAALRFWLSRLEDSLNQRPGDLTHCKNPEEYQIILKNHIKAEISAFPAD